MMASPQAYAQAAVARQRPSASYRTSRRHAQVCSRAGWIVAVSAAPLDTDILAVNDETHLSVPVAEDA